MKTLIFESGCTGHRKEWLRLLWAYSARLQSRGEGEFEFLLHPELVDYLKKEVAETSPVRLHSIRSEDLTALSIAVNARQKGQAEFACLREFLSSHAYQRLLLLYANTLQLHVSRIQNVGVVDCILFNVLSYSPGKMLGGVWRGGFGAWRKLLQYAYLSRSRKLGRVFVLEDRDTVSFLNQSWMNRPVFRLLRDPINSDVQNILDASRGSSGTCGEGDGESVRILSFGTIEPRKGVESLLNALVVLASRPIQYKLQVVLLGRFGSEAIRARVESGIERVVASASGVGNSVEFQRMHDYVSDQILARELRLCSMVHLGYIGFTGSSGVLGLSAAAGKPVVACREGLIGKTVADSGLGLVVDVEKSSAYADAIHAIASGNFIYDQRTARMLVEERTAELFADTLLAPSEPGLE